MGYASIAVSLATATVSSTTTVDSHFDFLLQEVQVRVLLFFLLFLDGIGLLFQVKMDLLSASTTDLPPFRSCPQQVQASLPHCSHGGSGSGGTAAVAETATPTTTHP